MARILIVEDETEMAMGLKDNFEFDGHEVIIAHDGEEGLQRGLLETVQLKQGLYYCQKQEYPTVLFVQYLNDLPL